MNLKVSIVVSTYNRSRLLKHCLSSLINQNANNKLFEIIVVDNNSIDNTKDIIVDFINDFPQFKISYVKETKQGLSYARNAGCINASGEYLAYIDDDAAASKNWIKNITRTIDKVKPDILGGPIYPYYLSKKPLWFKDAYEIRSQGNKERFLKEGENLSGSNFIIRKYILKKLGMFNTNLGMRGNRLRYGEEIQIMLEARKKIGNVQIYYNPEIEVKHLVKKSNLVLLNRLKNKFLSGIQNIDIYGKKRLSKFRFFVNINIALFKGAFLIFFGRFFRDKDECYYYENFIFEKVLPQVSWLAKNLRGFLS